jgi:hypothetical protein
MVSSRAVLVLLNTFFFFLGFGILAIGLWSQYDPNFSVLWKSFDITRVIDARSLNGASLLLIISGISSVLISFMGLYGALRKDKCFLTTYCLLVCIILILEIAAASVFISYKNQAPQQLERGLNETVQAINKDPTDKAALDVMNMVQSVFKCCGCKGQEDYLNVTQQVSCETSNSTPDKKDYYKIGCYTAIVDYINSHVPILIALAISLIFFQIFCLIVSIKACMGFRYEGYEDI